MWIYFWALNLVPRIYVYPYASITLSWLLRLCSKFWNQKVWFLKVCSSFSRLCSYCESPALSYKFWDQFVNFCKEASWNFDRDCIIKSMVSLKSIAILTSLSLPIHEHRMSFHLFRSSLFLQSFVVFRVYFMLLWLNSFHKNFIFLMLL